MKAMFSNFFHRFTPKKKKIKSEISDDLVDLKKQKLRNKLKFSAYLFLPLLLILVTLAYLISPLSKINKVTITGNKYISESDIRKELNINHGDSIFNVIGHKNDLNEKLTNNDHRVKAVDFSLKNLNDLTIKVIPYKKIGYETVGKLQYLILENGKVTNIAVKNPNDKRFPYIVKFKNSKQLKEMISKYLALPKDIRDNIRVISYSPTKIYPDELHLYMRDGNRVIVLESNFSYKMKFYRSIATQLKAKSIINLEVGAYSFPLSNVKKEYTPLNKISKHHNEKATKHVVKNSKNEKHSN